MKSPQRVLINFPSTPCRWLALLLFVSLWANSAFASGDADNPRKPDDLTPAERGTVFEEAPGKADTEVTLPPFPRASDLIPLRAESGDDRYTYYIDVNSVSLSADEILFYTIVIQSTGGAGNVLYEGIRCATDEVKSFAYGTRDGRFERMADAKWKYFYNEGALGYRTDLKETYACSEAGWAVEPDIVLERLVTLDPRRARVAPKKVDSGS